MANERKFDDDSEDWSRPECVEYDDHVITWEYHLGFQMLDAMNAAREAAEAQAN